MSSPLNSEPERIIPLADAPAPVRNDTPETPTQGSTAEPIAQGSSADPAAQGVSPADSAAFTRDPLNTLKFKPMIVEAVSKVFDPEIPVNIYELGLVYDIDVDAAVNVQIRMTLTAPACPAAQTIPVDVERHVREIAGVKDVKVAVVWDPPWTRDRMSEAAKLTLGMF
jgi:FeS assembly SUF system protein